MSSRCKATSLLATTSRYQRCACVLCVRMLWMTHRALGPGETQQVHAAVPVVRICMARQKMKTTSPLQHSRHGHNMLSHKHSTVVCV